MSQYPAGSYETQFEPHSDDEENLYDVERILAEKGNKYLVEWEGINPATGEKWPPDWVPKTDCTDDLIADWKREKAKMKKKGRATSLKSVSSAPGSLDVPPRPSKSRSVSGRSTVSQATEASTSTRSRSPAPRPKSTTSRREPSFYIEIPAPRRTKRRRDSDLEPEPLSPVKRMKLGGPASPLPASPFDNDDGGMGPTFPKKRNGPVTYKRRKPTVVKSPSFPKLTGPYIQERNVAAASSSRGPHPEPTKRQAKTAQDDEGSTKDGNTDTETEEESPPDLPSKSRTGGRSSPLKSKSEPMIKTRTRGTTRSALSELEPQRAASVPFERPHPTSAARTRDLPTRNRSAQREIKKQIILGLPGLPEDYPSWPRVVLRDESLRRRSGTKSRTSSVANTSHKGVEETSVGGPSVLPAVQAVPTTEAEVPRPVSPPPAPTPPVPPPHPSPEAPRRSSLAKSTAGSSGRPSSAKSVSFHVEGVDDFDEYQLGYEHPLPEDSEVDQERIMSSIEPENELSSREPVQPAPIEQPHSQSQSQSNSDSSKSTHISDSKDGVEGGGKEDGNAESEVGNKVKGVETEVEKVELEPPGQPGEEEEKNGDLAEDQGEEEEEEEEEEAEQEEEDDSDESQDEKTSIRSSPSLGGEVPSLPPVPDINMGAPSRDISPPAGTDDESRGEVEQAHAPEESFEETDVDVSMAHATEVDMLLSSDVSQRSEPTGHDGDQEEGSVPEQDNSTVEHQTNLVDDGSQERLAEESMNITQPVTDSSSGRMPPPDSRIAIDHRTTREVISALIPGILDTSSQSQSQSHSHSLPTETQERVLIPQSLPVQIISNVLVQPDSTPVLPPSQSQQEKTHSSIEEPTSSWSIPQPGQLPPQHDTISNFTPTNPGIHPSPAVPSPDRERTLPSSLVDGTSGHDGVSIPASQEPPSQVNGSEPSQEIGQDQSDIPFSLVSSRSSELGAVPEMSVQVFKQHTRPLSPESDIGEFSPQNSSPPRPSSRSSERALLQPYQRKEANQGSPSPRNSWNSTRKDGRTSLHGSPSFRFSAGEDSRKQIQEQATRIQTLLTDLANLETTKKAIEAAFEDSTSRLNGILQQEREKHTKEIEMQSATILDLQNQLEAVRSQYETAEYQREFALEQYTRASTEAKRMSDENKVLEAKIEKLERQLSSGLRQWQVGFESNVERYQQEVQTLKGQLAIEREMYARSKAPELCRRAAEWYELKKQIKELEEDAAEATQREALLRQREVEIRGRELAIADREQAFEDSVRATQSQAQTTERLSQDDLQTETMLTDQSAVLASLDGDLGDELVWMCSYREGTGKICGKVFGSMGMLLTHVLDAAGHKVEAACDCAHAS